MKRFTSDLAYEIALQRQARIVEEAKMWQLAQQVKSEHANPVSRVRKLLNTGFRLLEVSRGKHPEPQQHLRKRIIG